MRVSALLLSLALLGLASGEGEEANNCCERLAGLEAAHAESQLRLNDVQTSMQGKLGKCEQELDSVRAQVQAAGEEVNQARSSVAAITEADRKKAAELDGLRAQLGAKNKAFSTLESRLADAHKSLSEAAAREEAARAEAKAAQAEADKARAQVEEAQAKLSEAGSERVETLSDASRLFLAKSGEAAMELSAAALETAKDAVDAAASHWPAVQERLSVHAEELRTNVAAQYKATVGPTVDPVLAQAQELWAEHAQAHVDMVAEVARPAVDVAVAKAGEVASMGCGLMDTMWVKALEYRMLSRTRLEDLLRNEESFAPHAETIVTGVELTLLAVAVLLLLVPAWKLALWTLCTALRLVMWVLRLALRIVTLNHCCGLCACRGGNKGRAGSKRRNKKKGKAATRE